MKFKSMCPRAVMLVLCCMLPMASSVASVRAEEGYVARQEGLRTFFDALSLSRSWMLSCATLVCAMPDTLCVMMDCGPFTFPARRSMSTWWRRPRNSWTTKVPACNSDSSVPFSKGNAVGLITVSKAGGERPEQLLLNPDSALVSSYLSDNLAQVPDSRWRLADQQGHEHRDRHQQERAEEAFEEESRQTLRDTGEQGGQQLPRSATAQAQSMD